MTELVEVGLIDGKSVIPVGKVRVVTVLFRIAGGTRDSRAV